MYAHIDTVYICRIYPYIYIPSIEEDEDEEEDDPQKRLKKSGTGEKKKSVEEIK